MPIKDKKLLLNEAPERTIDDFGRIITRDLWDMNTYTDKLFFGLFDSAIEIDSNGAIFIKIEKKS